jgi:hypothetical protein
MESMKLSESANKPEPAGCKSVIEILAILNLPLKVMSRRPEALQKALASLMVPKGRLTASTSIHQAFTALF